MQLTIEDCDSLLAEALPAYGVSPDVQVTLLSLSENGTYLVTDEDDSPHLAARKSSAELYFACAETDRWAPLETVEALAKALAADGARAEVEIYPGAEHGFTFPQRALYQKQGAERHWERLNALYRRNLG